MIHSCNEWDPLKKVLVGNATGANWPRNDRVFDEHQKHSRWQETKLVRGPVNKQIVDEAQEELDSFADTLAGLGVEVVRPFTRNHEELDEFGSYSVRDNVLPFGAFSIIAPMTYAARQNEWELFKEHLGAYLLPDLNSEARFDAANICRLGDDLLYLASETGNRAGFEYIESISGDVRCHYLDNIYQGSHIDSTITPLKEGLVMLNADRVSQHNMPKPFEDWKKIYVYPEDVTSTGFDHYPYASNWIALNMLVVEPGLVICDPRQTRLRKMLEKNGVESIGCQLTHSRTLGGGHHCVTVDLVREA